MPRTEAGKSLVASQVWVGVARDLAVEVEKIETEAVAAERARIRAAVEGLRNPYRNHGGVGQGNAYGSGWEEARYAVLRLVEEAK